MKDLLKKLKVAAKDAEIVKELEKFGITADLIEEQEELELPATFDEALKLDGFQSEFDRRLAKAQKTREDNLKEKFELVEKEQKPEDKDKDKPSNANQEVLDYIKKLEKRLDEKEEAEKVQTTEQKKAAFIEKLKTRNIPEIYVGKLDLEKDFDEQVKTVEEAFRKDFGSVKGDKIPVPRNPGETKPSKEEEKEFNKHF